MEICVDLWTIGNVAIHLRQGYGGQDVKVLPVFSFQCLLSRGVRIAKRARLAKRKTLLNTRRYFIMWRLCQMRIKVVDIESVIDAERDLVEPLVRLVPLASLKG